jgi:hypothetical protein
MEHSNILMNLIGSGTSFMSVVVIAWITQRIITYWEKRKKIEETKLSIYMMWLPFLAKCYAGATYPDDSEFDAKEFLKMKMEILGTLQIMGPDAAINAASEYLELAELAFKKDETFNKKIFHRCFTQLNYCLCCEIHGEAYRGKHG